ncbi:MAG TPA: lysylphosphatidylglycerol synthase domain-containing protein [Gaiellales bacterium]|jgi:peptidoglycan-N-acetylglucosamine deacetylase|nr:lysylphosphatidylglycerol synthase domain-containing protein [Gaiellales bacterium]
MGKRDVIVRFVIAAAVWLTAAAVLGKEVGGRPGEILVAVAVLVLMAVAWATFTPNARLFGRVVGVGSTARPLIAITFDDGPSPEWTPGVLDALRDAGARATFFTLGRQVRAHPDIARRIVDEGHELASHGDDHSLLVFAGPRAIAHQFRAAESALADAVDGKASKLFRAPHGYRNPFVSAIAGQEGYRMVGWHGAVFDTARPGVDAIVARCRDVLRPGAILLLHDGDGSGQGGDRGQTVAAVPHILATAREQGLEPVTVSQLAEELRPERRTALKAAAFALVVAALVLLVSQRYSLQVIANVFTEADPVFVLAALLANLGSVAAKSLTWKSAIDAVPADAHGRRLEVPVRDVVPPIFIGFLLNTVLIARLGEVARVTVLRRKLVARGQAVPVTTLVGTLVTEQILSGIMLVGVLLGVIAFTPVPQQAVYLLAVLSGVVLLIALVAAGIEIASRIQRKRMVPTAPYVERWWHLLGISFTSTMVALREGQAIFRRPRLLAWGLTMAAISWVMQLAGIYWALRAYGIDEGLGAAGVVFLASNLVQLFPITPGNLGVFQGATAGGLSVLYPVASDLALTFAIGLQLIEAALGVGIGFVFLSLEGLSVAELRRQVEVEADP